MYLDLIRVRPYKRQKPPAHGDGARIRIGEAEDVGGRRIGLQEYFTDAGSQDLGLPGTGARNDHDGAFRRIHGKTLLVVQFLVFIPEMLQQLFPVD
jgi:hypothetical protein